MNSPELSEQDVIDICSNYYNRMGPLVRPFEMVSFNVAGVNEVPNGFLSQQCILYVKCLIDGEIEEVMSFFVKFLPNCSAKHLEYIEDFCAFKKESLLYQYVIPNLQTLSSYNYAAKCYLVKENNFLIFDNLSSMGFMLCPGDSGVLDIKHIIVALEAIASLHASSIVYEHSTSKLLTQTYPNYLNENAYPPQNANMDKRRLWVSNTIAVLCELIKNIPEFSGKTELIIPKFSVIMNEIFELCKPSKKFRNVFSHGDLWSNNIMFRYADFTDGMTRNDRIPIEAKLLDFQLSRYAPPALDLLTLITITTNSAFRGLHLNTLVNRFYEHLSGELKQHGLNADIEYPLHEFRESCEYYRLAGLIESCLFSHITVLPKCIAAEIVSTSENFENFMNFSRVKLCLKAFDADVNYQYRMTDIITEIVNCYILPGSENILN